MYLHSRECEEDFLKILKENRHKFKDGCVHSFTGTINELKELLSLGLYIGVNCQSMQDEKGIEVVKEIPIDRLMIESKFIFYLIQPIRLIVE